MKQLKKESIKAVDSKTLASINEVIKNGIDPYKGEMLMISIIKGLRSEELPEFIHTVRKK